MNKAIGTGSDEAAFCDTGAGKLFELSRLVSHRRVNGGQHFRREQTARVRLREENA